MERSAMLGCASRHGLGGHGLGGHGAGRRQRAALASVMAAAMLGATVLTATMSTAPASAASLRRPAVSRSGLHGTAAGRLAAAGRAYPVLSDGTSSRGTGMLTETGPTWTVSFRLKDPGPIAVAPDGKFAYAATAGGVAVIGKVNTAHPKITATVKTGGTPGGIAITPNGSRVYVTVSSSKRSLVKAYAGASTGRLRLAASVATRPGANAIAITPDGKYAYVAVNDAPRVYFLTEIGGVGTARPRLLRNIGIAGYPEAVTVTPNGQYVYEVSNMGVFGSALAFRHAQSGHPTLAREFSPPGQGGVSPVAVTPSGHWAYAAYLGKLMVIKNAQTSPAHAGTAKAGYADGEMVFQPGGRYAIEAALSGSHGELAVLTGTSSGHPKVAATWKLGYFPLNVAISRVRSAATLAAATRPVLASAVRASSVLASAVRASAVRASAAKVKISVSDFNRNFTAMKRLKPLIRAGHGKIAVILPDTVSSVRYVRFDAPDLKRAFKTAGLAGSQLLIQNALGSDATQVADAQADITEGAKVLILDPLDSGAGQVIESYAKRHGVAVIDYDRLTVGGSRRYFAGFDDVAVGQAIGRGLVSCVSAWGVKKPKVIVMKGDPADRNATLFAQGYDGVMAPYFKSGKWTRISAPPGTWDPPTALSEFKQQYAAHPSINAALTPEDEISAPIIAFLKGRGIKARTFPITGQFATLPGLQNVLTGYQCGTAYQPPYLEPQGAAALALFLRARMKPPASLVNGHSRDGKASVPSVLFKPTWVTTKNMKSTVIADKYVSVSRLCAGRFAAACKAAGITG
jgi:D-xylose transport system substrate-binding protein